MNKWILFILGVLIMGGFSAWLIFKSEVDEIPQPPALPDENGVNQQIITPKENGMRNTNENSAIPKPPQLPK